MNLCLNSIIMKLMNKRSGAQSPPAPKTDCYLGLMINSYYQERMPYVEILSKKKKKKPIVKNVVNFFFFLCIAFFFFLEVLHS